MQVVSSHEGAVTILRPLGPLVTGELEDLDKALTQMRQDWTQRIVVNMADVSHIDSAGLELISQHQHQLKDHGLRLKLCGMNDITQTIFDLTRVAQQFEIYADSAAALRSFL